MPVVTREETPKRLYPIFQKCSSNEHTEMKPEPARSGDPNQFVCPICKKVFKHDFTLRGHILTIHEVCVFSD